MESGGVTAIETNVAFVTVMFVVALIPAKAAVIVVPPMATPVATPPLLDALLTVATDGADEVQVAAEVRSNCWPSENVPVALSWVSMVAGSFRFCGVILIDTRLDPSTTRCALALNVPDVAGMVAVMVAVPADCPVVLPEMPTVAIWVSDEDQLVKTLMFCELLSVQVPFALICNVEPGASSALIGLTAMDLSVAELTISAVLPVALVPA
jgi:hypothetical protein